MITTVMKLWWKGVLPTIVAGVLAIELFAGGAFMMNQPQDVFVATGVAMWTAIIVVVAVWVAWIRRSFFKGAK